MSPSSPRERDSDLVRVYVVTGGRSAPSRNTLDLVTLVMVTSELPRSGLNPEQRRLMELCLPGALSVAEIGSHLALPVSVLRVLIADLMDSGHLTTRAPIPAAQRPDRKLLEDILRGLHAL